jgi:hypothetical protein
MRRPSNELLDREIFYTLTEAQTVIEPQPERPYVE